MNKFYPAQLEPLATRNRVILSNLLKGEEYVRSLQDPGEDRCLCSSRGLTRACSALHVVAATDSSPFQSFLTLCLIFLQRKI